MSEHFVKNVALSSYCLSSIKFKREFMNIQGSSINNTKFMESIKEYQAEKNINFIDNLGFSNSDIIESYSSVQKYVILKRKRAM